MKKQFNTEINNTKKYINIMKKIETNNKISECANVYKKLIKKISSKVALFYKYANNVKYSNYKYQHGGTPEFDALNDAITALETALGKIDFKDIEKNKADNIQLRTELQQLNDAKSNAEKNVDAIRVQLDSLQKQYNKSINDYVLLKEENKRLTDGLSSSESMYNKEKISWDADKQRLEKSNQELLGKLNQNENEIVKSDEEKKKLTEDIEKLKQDLQTEQKSMGELQGKINEYEEDRKHYQELSDKLRNMVSRIEGLYKPIPGKVTSGSSDDLEASKGPEEPKGSEEPGKGHDDDELSSALADLE
jgi:hypothetical protein